MSHDKAEGLRVLRAKGLQPPAWAREEAHGAMFVGPSLLQICAVLLYKALQGRVDGSTEAHLCFCRDVYASKLQDMGSIVAERLL